MSHTLLLTVHFHEGRYHGSGAWPPSPARLFQALVAGVARGSQIPEEAVPGLTWMESAPPPVIAAPHERRGQGFINYVPNNDLDAVDGDPARVADIRTAKPIRPYLFDAKVPLCYWWTLKNQELGGCLCLLANSLYQLGRGTDMAWACAELLSHEELERKLATYPGASYRPSLKGDGLSLPCPVPGSLDSLRARFKAQAQRFQRLNDEVVLAQAPPARWRRVVYNSKASRILFELHSSLSKGGFAPWKLEGAGPLVTRLRDAGAERLKHALPEKAEVVVRALEGRTSSTEEDKAERIRVLPIPSLGHPNVHPAIRRLVIEVPPQCPLAPADVAWAFEDLSLVRRVSPTTGEVELTHLVLAEDTSMLEHFGFDTGHTEWSTITPVVLPARAARRRIDPDRRTEEAKSGRERQREEFSAATAVLQALRHAGIGARVETLRVQREPFHARGARAELFAPETRFAKERCWHVCLTFATPVTGPLIIGDGRYVGLGLLAPSQSSKSKPCGLLAFQVQGGLDEPGDPEAICQALRRAVMARVQRVLGPRIALPSYFSGHQPDGTKTKDDHFHLYYAFDPVRRLLLAIPPGVLDSTRSQPRHEKTLREALEGMNDLRAGRAGRLALLPLTLVQASDPLLAPSRDWESLTDYQVTRHLKKLTAQEALVANILEQVKRRGLPEAVVEVLQVRGAAGGLRGRLRLRFRVAISGPLLLGRTMHSGGGLFIGSG